MTPILCRLPLLASLLLLSGCGALAEVFTPPPAINPSATPRPTPTPRPNQTNVSNSGRSTPAQTPSPNSGFVSPAEITSLNFDDADLTISLNEERPLDLLLKNQRRLVMTQGILWQSSDSTVATVSSSSGRVRGLSVGKTVITASVQGQPGIKAQLELQIADRPSVKNITVSPSSPGIPLGRSQKLIASVFLPDGQINSDVRWESSDAKIASVDAANGEVTPHSEGLVTILAIYKGDERYRGSARITVLPASAAPIGAEPGEIIPPASVLPSANPNPIPGTSATPLPGASPSPAASPSVQPSSSPTPSPAVIPVPTELTSSSVTTTGFSLSWTAVTGASSYKVFKEGVLVDSVAAPPFNLSGLQMGSSYAMTVAAVTDAGESAKSAALAVKTALQLPGKILFVSNRDGGNKYYQISSNGQVSAYNNLAYNSKAAFSLDGQKYVTGGSVVSTMNFDGSNPVTVVANGPAGSNYAGDITLGDKSSPIFSPDKSKIIFTKETYRIAISCGTCYAFATDLWLVNADGTNPLRLTTDANVNTNQPVFRYQNALPSWAPDGSKIAFVSSRNGNDEIYTMNPDGSNQTNLTQSAGNESAPQYSPDGSKLLYRTGNDLYVMDSSGANRRKLFTVPGNSTTVSWSPDSSMIAYTLANGANSNDFEINIYNLSDGSSFIATENIYSDSTPFWLP